MAVLRARAENESDGGSPTREIGAVQTTCEKIVPVLELDLFDFHFRSRRGWPGRRFVPGSLAATCEGATKQEHAEKRRRGRYGPHGISFLQLASPTILFVGKATILGRLVFTEHWY
jgi:hypothetical protein